MSLDRYNPSLCPKNKTPFQEYMDTIQVNREKFKNRHHSEKGMHYSASKGSIEEAAKGGRALSRFETAGKVLRKFKEVQGSKSNPY